MWTGLPSGYLDTIMCLFQAHCHYFKQWCSRQLYIQITQRDFKYTNETSHPRDSVFTGLEKDLGINISQILPSKG